MDVLAAAIALGAALLAWAHPGAGALAVLAVGFVMDPLRKVMPGEPVWLTGVVALVVVALYVGVRRRGRGPGVPTMLDAYPPLRLPLVLGVVWVVIQVVRGYDTTGSAVVALIGLMAYAMPALAIATGYGLFQTNAQVERFLHWYVVAVTVVAVTVLLAFSGVASPLFKQVGRGIVIYAPHIGIIRLHGGVLRGPELAGWHLATALCVLALLAVGSRRRVAWTWAIPCFALLAPALFVTGRRKYLVLVGVFALLWAAMSLRHRRGKPLAAVGLMAVAVLAVVFLTREISGSSTRTEVLQRHVARVAWGGTQAQDRLTGLAVESLPLVLAQNGALGSGAGTGSQGSQHFGGGSRITGASAEGGLGKVLAELGLPGLALSAWLAIALAAAALRAVRRLGADAQGAAELASGLAAMLAANLLTFSVGHQVYGDPFVLCVLGLLAGTLLALPHLERRPAPLLGSHGGCGGAVRTGAASLRGGAM